MPRPPTTKDGAIELAQSAILSARTTEELRVAQAVLLPLLGLTLEETAKATGKGRTWVSRMRNHFLRTGDMPPLRHKQGGRRHQLFSQEEEVALVKKAILNSRGFGKSIRGELRALIAAKRNGIVAESTLTDMISRVTPIFMPGAKPWQLERYSTRLIAVWKAEAELRRLLR